MTYDEFKEILKTSKIIKQWETFHAIGQSYKSHYIKNGEKTYFISKDSSYEKTHWILIEAEFGHYTTEKWKHGITVYDDTITHQKRVY